MDQIISHCASVYPVEACGLLAGNQGRVKRVYEMTNIENSTVSYFMDSREQFRAFREIRDAGLSLVAIYHSHPHSAAYPSPKDVNLAFYAEVPYVIVSLADYERPAVKAFRIVDGRVAEIAIEISRAAQG